MWNLRIVHEAGEGQDYVGVNLEHRNFRKDKIGHEIEAYVASVDNEFVASIVPSRLAVRSFSKFTDQGLVLQGLQAHFEEGKLASRQLSVATQFLIPEAVQVIWVISQQLGVS